AVSAAIAHTPTFVWPLIAVVLFLGARNLTTRERPLSQMFILPAVLLIFAIYNLAASRADPTLPIAAFVVSFAIGVGVGWNLVPGNVVPIRERGAVRVPGSVAPLLVVIAIVILRYAVGYVYGRWPEMRSDAALALEFSATGALLAGIVWGRILRLAQIYRRS
ncbi:MAG: DUF6622 family protein, partial [Stellaceae bacterium]